MKKEVGFVVMGALVIVIGLWAYMYYREFHNAGHDVSAATKGTVIEDGVIKYRGAEWSGSFNGLKTKVNSVYLEKADDGRGQATIWITVKNTTKDRSFTTELGRATVIANGYNIPDTLFQDDFEGEIQPGKTMDGDLVVKLSEKDLKSIKQIFLTWDQTDKKTMKTQETTAKIKLK
ncbi:hypothetical protein [Fictibacillus terranigra]|uniref:DUF4352 domain-containing protein n=1 Tax=Fictibacillus terranigra TaxID=3058424 RepID=A0ABT8E6V6_9BACL|nr:hypothetical protein [Fictibacillus sp. CENA-BCM004]MDN4073641.1 hypothetical protein [Fictibacillus sp. CENA-BCM004]